MADHPPLPQSLGGYTVEGPLREGSGIVVARARDGLGLPIVLHFYEAEKVRGRIPKELFFDEVRRTAAIHHERLAAVVNAGEKGPWWFVACKGSEGATLANLFSRGGGMDEERALGIFAAIAEGTSALQTRDLRYGGLDPASVSLPGAGQVLLGLRRLLPSDLSERDLRYLSPEEARGQEGTVASDLFSLGLLLLEALLGHPPMEGTAEEVRVRTARGQVPDPAALLKGTLPQTVDLAASLLSVDPAGRPASAAEAARRLRALQGAFSATESLEGSMDAPVVAVPVRIPDAPPAAPPATRRAPSGAAPVVPPVPAAPPVAPAAAPPAASPSPLRPRRAHARLILPRRGVELIHEILDPVTWIGADEGGTVVARSEKFPGAVAQLEVGAQVDYLFATGTPPAPKVKGKEVQRHELKFGDEIRIAGKEVIFEKAEKLLPEGAEGAGEVRSRHALRRRGSRAPVVAGVAVCVALAGWGAVRLVAVTGHWSEEIDAAAARARELESKVAALPAPESSAGGGGAREGREEAAFRILDYAREAGRPEETRDRLQKLLRDYPDTAAAVVARGEVKSVRGEARETGLGELAELQARADALAAEGKTAEARDLLVEFARRHPGSFLGDRAERAAATLLQINADRVDALLREARAASDRKDWAEAIAAANRAVTLAVGEALDRAREERDRVFQRKPRSVPGTEGAEAPPAEPPGPGSGKGGKPEPERPAAGGPDPGGPGEDPAPGGGREEEAVALFRSAREALEGNRPGEAERSLYRLLADYGDTRYIRDYGVEVRNRLGDAIKKGRGVAGLFHGGLAFKGRGVSLTYEFEGADEAVDWETVHPFLVPQRGTFAVDRGEVAGQGAAAFLLRAAFRPDTVTLSFRIRPGIPAQDMGAMMAEPPDLANHLLFTIGNQFFALGKGSGTYAIPGNVIFVFGKGMWRDTDPGMVGFVRTGVSEDPKVKPRKWAEVEVSKDRDRARFVIDGKAIPGRSVGDNKYELKGIRPGLFVLLSEARFDEVVVEGELDPAWVASERARVFPELK